MQSRPHRESTTARIPTRLAFVVCDRIEQGQQDGPFRLVTLHGVRDGISLATGDTITLFAYVKLTDAEGDYRLALVGVTDEEAVTLAVSDVSVSKPSITFSKAMPFTIDGGDSRIITLRMFANEVMVGQIQFPVRVRPRQT